jgi:hypothetical protein
MVMMGLALQGGLGRSRAEGFSMPGDSSSALALMGSDNSRGLTPAFSDHQAPPISGSPLDGYIPRDYEKHVEEFNRKLQERPSITYGPKEAQGPSDEKTSQPAENLSSLQKAQGIHLEKKVKIAGLSDVRSRKVEPGGRNAQSAMETPLHQREQSEGKRAESFELSGEEIDTLKSFAAFLKGHAEARKCLREVWNDKEVMRGISDLMQDEVVRRCVISELKKKENVEQALLFWEHPKALQVLKKVFTNKEHMETFKNLIQDKRFRGHDLYSLEGTQKSYLTRRSIQEVNQTANTTLPGDTSNAPVESPPAISPSSAKYGFLVAVGIACTLYFGPIIAIYYCCQRSQRRQEIGPSAEPERERNRLMPERNRLMPERNRPMTERNRPMTERNRLITEFANQLVDKLTFGFDGEHSDGEQSVKSVSQSDSCNKGPDGPKDQRDKMLVWSAIANLKGETINGHKEIEKKNTERFEEMKIWFSKEFEKWKERQLVTSRPLTLGGPSSSLRPEGSSSEPVPHRGIEMSPLPSERMGPHVDEGAVGRAIVRSMVGNESRMSHCNNEEATTSARVPSQESSNRGKQIVSVYDDPGPLSRTSSSSSL